MKVKEYLKELPFRCRELAIQNAIISPTDNMETETDSLKTALELAFFWHDSPQGFKYWARIHKKL